MKTVKLRMGLKMKNSGFLMKILVHIVCSRVKAFITDSDPQLISMIDLAIKKKYVNAFWLACGCPPNPKRKFISKKVVSFVGSYKGGYLLG